MTTVLNESTPGRAARQADGLPRLLPRAPEDLRAHLEGKFAKFWLPDAYVFLEQIPRTSTGKFLKTKLRESYGGLLEK